MSTTTSKWSDPSQIALDSQVLGLFTLVLSGIATWNVLSTISFDLSIIARRRPWRWPMLIYLVLRIDMLTYFTLALMFGAFTEVPCQPIGYFLKISDAIATCGSVLILVLRTRAVWQQDAKVSLGLGGLFLVLVVFFGRGLTTQWARSVWDPKINACIATSTSPTSYLVALRTYTMAFDFVIIVLCIYRLRYLRRSSTLAYILLRDGVVYFCAAFIANLLQAVMAALNLNPVMTILTMPFTLLVSVIASTTVFRNVFIAYDGFEDNSANWLRTRDGPGILRFLSRLLTTISSPIIPTDVHVPSNDQKSQDIASRGVVDATVDTVVLPPTSTKACGGGSDDKLATNTRPDQFDA